MGAKRRGVDISQLEQCLEDESKLPHDNANYQALAEHFKTRPEGQISAHALAKWDKLGPIDLREWIVREKVKFDPDSRVAAEHGFWYGQERISGIGRYIYNNGILEGEFDNGTLNGLARWIYGDGSYYVGHFKYDLRDGEGILYKTTGKCLSGLWMQNEFSGPVL